MYLEEELPPAIVPSLWLNEVDKSEKSISAETLSRQGDCYITGWTCPVAALGTDRQMGTEKPGQV